MRVIEQQRERERERERGEDFIRKQYAAAGGHLTCLLLLHMGHTRRLHSVFNLVTRTLRPLGKDPKAAGTQSSGRRFFGLLPARSAPAS
jgi:hypothetical protein